MVIHRDLTSKHPSPSPEQMKEALKPYQEWIASIGARDKLVADGKSRTGNGLCYASKEN